MPALQKKWQLLPAPPENFFAEHPELPQVVAALLYNRNILKAEQIDEFLQPDYTKDIHDPFLFQDMQKAVLRLFQAIEKQEKITIHGDYDADGVCASVILTDTLRSLGAKNLNVYLPHRETDGYGLNMHTVEYLHSEGTNVIITCDCGISNRAEVAKANELGIDVIITDHHTIPAALPDALAIIHPKIETETYPDKNLAGGGVAFKLAQGLLRTHSLTHTELPNGEKHAGFEKWLLDMVAISSVADMVPLLGESRTLTKYGLIVLNKTRRIGLQKLLLEAHFMESDGTKKRDIDAGTIGFLIAPRINAAGRLEHANVAYNLLVAKDNDEASALAFSLGQNNQERRNLTDTFVEEAVKQVEAEQMENPVLFVYGETWLAGLVGLIASRLKEKYQKPVIAFAKKQDEIMGSGRSVAGFNMIGALQEIPECFQKFGGHPMACGFTLVGIERHEFEQKLTKKYLEKTAELDMTPTLTIDAAVDLDDITWELYDILEKFSPFGQCNERPRYLATGVTVVRFDTVGANAQHLRLQVKQNSSVVKKTIGWNLCDSTPGGKNWAKELSIGDKLDLVFEVEVNEWNGNRELQLTLVDLRKEQS